MYKLNNWFIRFNNRGKINYYVEKNIYEGEDQNDNVINELKDSISCSNYELLTALRNWVDSIYARPNGFLSKTAITIFQNTLNEYTKGDLDLALRIVQIASVQGYKNCEWAIALYEKDQKQKSKVQKERIRITEQVVASKEDLSDKIF